MSMSNVGYEQFIRGYRLLILPKNGGDGIDVSQLRIVFYIEKSTTETPNYSQIIIYNLAQSTIAGIKAGDKVILEAGYEKGNVGMIFSGEIVQPYVAREGSVDIALHLICQDGDEYLTSAYTAQTLAKGSTLMDAASACSSGMEKNILTSKLNKKYIRGKVLFGKSAQLMRVFAKTTKSQFFVNDGKVNICAAEDYDGNTAVELNPMTGLIETPNQTDDGVSAKCLLNPSLKLNSLIHINANLIAVQQASTSQAATDVNADGIYRIVKMTYEGDTRGQAWYCTFDAVTQSGAKPDGLVQGQENPWR